MDDGAVLPGWEMAGAGEWQLMGFIVDPGGIVASDPQLIPRLPV